MNPHSKTVSPKQLTLVLATWLVALFAATCSIGRADSVVDLIGKSDPAKAQSKNVFRDPGDNRKAIVSTKYPGRAIGKLVSGNGGGCTGTLVGNRLVLTAAHCVLENGELQALTFYPNQIGGESLVSSEAIRTAYGTSNPQENRTSDWAIVVLKENIGAVYGFLGVKNTTASNFPSRFIVAGYSYDFAGGETAGAAIGNNRGDHNGLIYHDAATARGASGGPVLGSTDGETLAVVGINVAEKRNGGDKSLLVDHYDDDYANIAIPTEGLMETLVKLRDAGY